MKQTSVSSTWRVSIFTGEVFGGHCAFCGIVLPNETLFHGLNQHQAHLAAVSVWVRIIHPEGYCGLELKLPADLFVKRDHPYLEKVLHLPAIVFQFSCLRCQIQSAATNSEVRAFRSAHARHIHLARLHMVVQNRAGRAVRLTFPVFDQKGAHSVPGVQAPAPCADTLARADRLRGLLQILRCTLSSLRCSLCRSTCLLEDQAEMQHEFVRHQRHWSELQVEFCVEHPEEYAGLQLRARATHLPPHSCWLAPQFKLDGIFLELSRQRGGPTVTPWNAAMVEKYFQHYHSQPNPAKFLAVVRGPSYAHVCQFQVTHIHFSAASQISEWEQLFLQPAGETA